MRDATQSAFSGPFPGTESIQAEDRHATKSAHALRLAFVIGPALKVLLGKRQPLPSKLIASQGVDRPPVSVPLDADSGGIFVVRLRQISR